MPRTADDVRARLRKRLHDKSLALREEARRVAQERDALQAKYTKEEQDEFTKHYMSGYDDDTWTVEGKARLRQLCLSTLEYCTELNWDCPVRQMVLALQECPPLSDAETELSQYSDDEV